MLKVMLMMKRKPGLSLEEFIDHYERVHVPLALTNARNLVHYERHYLHPGRFVPFGDELVEPDYDVITELWYDVWPLIVMAVVLIPAGVWVFGYAERYAKRTGKLKRVG